MVRKQTVIVYSWYPQTQARVYELLEGGWEITEVWSEDQKSCFSSHINGTQATYYELQKSP